MMYNYMWGSGTNFFGGHLFGWLLPLMLLDLVLRGLSLWRSAQKKEQWWFIALLVVNSLGILPIIYLLTHPTKKGKK